MNAFFASLLRRLDGSRIARAFGHDAAGVSAVEFALVLPVMALLMAGGAELTAAINIDRKTTMVARTVADLTAQSASSVTVADVQLYMDAGKTVVAPYGEANVRIVLSSVLIDASGNPKIVWSTATSGSARATNSVPTLDTNLKVAKSSLIWAEVEYSYTPSIGYAFTGAVKFKEQLFMRPRSQNQICHTSFTCPTFPP